MVWSRCPRTVWLLIVLTLSYVFCVPAGWMFFYAAAGCVPAVRGSARARRAVLNGRERLQRPQQPPVMVPRGRCRRSHSTAVAAATALLISIRPLCHRCIKVAIHPNCTSTRTTIITTTTRPTHAHTRTRSRMCTPMHTHTRITRTRTTRHTCLHRIFIDSAPCSRY